MNLKLNRLERTEWVGMAAAVLLLVSTFLPWFYTDPDNPNSQINGEKGTANVWEAFDIVQILLVLCCLAPFVLAWIIARDHHVGWDLGEITGIVGAIALTTVIVNSVVFGQPGESASLTFGVPIAAFAATVMLFSGAMRATKYRKKQPPGV